MGGFWLWGISSDGRGGFIRDWVRRCGFKSSFTLMSLFMNIFSLTNLIIESKFELDQLDSFIK